MFRRILKRLLTPPMVVIAAAILFFEDWLWDRLTKVMARVARAPFFRWLEAKLAALPPYGAMAVFLVPGALLLPVKIAALYLIARGHPGGGLAIILAAKVIGTAIVARIFTVCRPSLLTVRWFRRLYEWIVRLKERLVCGTAGDACVGDGGAVENGAQSAVGTREPVCAALARHRANVAAEIFQAVLSDWVKNRPAISGLSKIAQHFSAGPFGVGEAKVPQGRQKQDFWILPSPADFALFFIATPH